MDRIKKFYVDGTYFSNNPDWDSSDAEWKFSKLQKIFSQIPFQDADVVVEVGCGGGDVLKKFAQQSSHLKFEGWDIAPQAERFWKTEIKNIEFHVGDFLEVVGKKKVKALLLIDVLEHVADPVNFLAKLADKTDYVLIHLPLDMTSINALFDQRLINMRLKVGHIHYFTRSLGLQMVRESGFEIIYSGFTQAWVDSPQLTTLGRVFKLVRLVVSFFSENLNAKLLGGETLIILCRPSRG